MRTFDKSAKLDNVLYDVRGPVVDEAAKMEEEGKEILKLNIGNPYPFGFSAPQEVILDMLSNIRTSQGYSDSKGIFSARKAIMQYAQLRGIPNVTMNDIYTGNGAVEPKSMLWSMVRSFCGSSPFLRRMYSKTISGMPPLRPPRTFFPFRSSHLKSGISSLATRKFPAR